MQGSKRTYLSYTMLASDFGKVSAKLTCTQKYCCKQIRFLSWEVKTVVDEDWIYLPPKTGVINKTIEDWGIWF